MIKDKTLDDIDAGLFIIMTILIFIVFFWIIIPAYIIGRIQRKIKEK